MKDNRVKTLEEEKKLLLENLIDIANVIVETFGKNCEVAVHDLDDLQKSLVYISGNVTKRKPGAPITDLVVKALRKEGNEVKNITNYRTSTVDGRPIKSSTCFSRNSNGEVVCALCINFEITEYLNSISMIENFIRVDSKKHQDKAETFASLPNETISSLFDEAVAQIGKQPTTMTAEEKIKLVEKLEYKGAFMIKGAVDQIALAMGVSKFSVYSYLKKVRFSHEKNIL